MKTISEITHLFKSSLEKVYSDGELNQIIFLVFEDLLNFRKIDLIIKKEEAVSPKDEIRLMEILNSLNSGLPIQYILGNAWFDGMKLKVNSSVLIPRQETEELIHLIRKDFSERKVDAVIDICTGSGCIALALKRSFPDAGVTALDISNEALVVATSNAIANHLTVEFVNKDFLKEEVPGIFDIIVSNPPYIMESEKELMKDLVLLHEPHLALFVPEDDAMIFYRRLADYSFHHLSPAGSVYAEINEAKAEEARRIFEEKGFLIEIHRDLNGKNRMLCAVRKG